MLGAVCLLALAGAALAQPLIDANNETETTSLAPTEASTEAVTEASTEAVTEAPPPVHQRFPHAVLYGGACGGSIIGDKWVITAAHCTLFTSGRNVLAGTSNSAHGTGTSMRVKKLYIHPLFSVGPYWVNARQFGIKQVAARWDYMLVELTKPLPLDGVNMAAVALDGEPEVPANLSVGYAGYGAEFHGDVMRHDMHGMELHTLSDEQCGKLQQYNAQDMVCAEGRTERRDSACNGDSGSGLVTDGPGPRRLIGVASWVENDAHECRPGAIVVFSRVAAARPWIKEITGI